MNKYLFIEVNVPVGNRPTETVVTEYNLDFLIEYHDILDPLNAFKHIFLDRVVDDEEFFNVEVKPYVVLNSSKKQANGSTYRTVTYENEDLGMIILVSSEM